MKIPKPKVKAPILIDNRMASQIRKEAMRQELSDKIAANMMNRQTPMSKRASDMSGKIKKETDN